MIIGIHGRLDTLNSNIFENRLTELMDQQVNRILVNCSQMDYISSSGLRRPVNSLEKDHAG